MKMHSYSESSLLIRRILGDFLSLAAWFKLQFKVSTGREKKEYLGAHGISELWRDILGPYYNGSLETKKASSVNVSDMIALKDIHLSSFISRAPGLLQSSGYRLFRGSNDMGRYPFIGKPIIRTANLKVKSSLEAAKIAESVTGLKPQPSTIGLLEGEGGLLFYMVPYGIGPRTITVQIDAQSGDILEHYDSSRLDDVFLRAKQAHHERVKSGARGVVRFKEHKDKILLSAYVGTVECGFPVVISKNAYSKIGSLINRYGSAHIEELKGTVERIPESFLGSKVGRPIFEWGSGVPQVSLLIGSQRQIKHPGTPDPHQNFASAWNLGKSKNRLSYNYQLFRIGLEDYERRIMDAVRIVQYEFRTLEMTPLFDFDEAKSRFPEAVYGPNYFLERLEIEPHSPEKLLHKERPIIFMSALHKEKESFEAKVDKLHVFARKEAKNGINELSNRNSPEVIGVTKAIGRTGNQHSREALGKIVETYEPKLVILFGIAAGIHGRVKIGDIVIADRVWDLRKCEILEDEKFKFEPEPLNSPTLFSLPIQIGELREMLCNEFNRNIAIHTDLLCGSSDNLIRNREFMEAASRTNRKLGAMEMEAAGIAEICRSFNIPFYIVKAISDYGYDKTDNYHELCCQLAADCALKEFLLSQSTRATT